MKNSIARKLAQIPPGALLVGIDPHKKVHAVVVMTPQAQVLTKFKVAVSAEGFRTLRARVEQAVRSQSAPGALYAIEAGSHQWRTLATALDGQGLPFRLINPFTLKRQREGQDLDRRKNDYRDAAMAAELVRTGKFTETVLLRGDYAELRAAHQAYQRAQQAATRLKNQIQALLDGHFPEFTAVFKDIQGQTALAALEAEVAPRALAALEPAAWVQQVRAVAPGRRLGVRKLEALRARAGTSIGVPEGARGVSAELGHLARRLRQVQEEVAAWATRLAALVARVPEYPYLRTLPGLGVVTIAGLVAEIGPFGRFREAGQLIKLAGTNPTQTESAGKAAAHTPMSKKGRAALRRCLWLAALAVLRHNAEFAAWAKARRERAQHPLKVREVLGAVGNRLLRVLFALVRKQEVYHVQTAQAAA